jgi:hypothetical protein
MARECKALKKEKKQDINFTIGDVVAQNRG